MRTIKIIDVTLRESGSLKNTALSFKEKLEEKKSEVKPPEKAVGAPKQEQAL